MSIMKLRNRKVKLGDKGFTLVELIVVIAILAVLTAILAPQFTRYVEKSRVAADVATADEIRRAIQMAIAEDVDGKIDAADGVVWQTTGALDVTGDELSESLVKSLGAITGITMKATSHSSSALTFDINDNLGVDISGWAEFSS